MKKIALLTLIFTFVIGACSSVNLGEVRYEKFQSNMDMMSFFSNAADTFRSDGFSVLAIDENSGSMRASKYVAKDFSMDVLLSFDSETKNVSISVVNRIYVGEKFKDNIEYYDLTNYNSKYKEKFHSALEAIKVNATKTAFPNR